MEAPHRQPAPAGPSPVEPRAVLRAVDRRVLPLLWLLAALAYIDRAALAYAAAPLRQEVPDLDARAYSVAASAFFLTYVLFEVPSNIALARVGAPRWLSFIVLGWGLAAASTALVRSPAQLYATRLVMGAFEAGAFPGSAYTIHQWYGGGRFLTRYPVVTTAIPVAGALGGPLAALLLEMGGWRTLFVFEGVLAVPLALLLLWRLPASPDDARWLSSEEAAWLLEDGRRGDQQTAGKAEGKTVVAALKDWRVWYLGCVWCLLEVPTYGTIFWLPLFVGDALGYSSSEDGGEAAAKHAATISVVSSVPFGLAAAAMLLLAWVVRRRNGRKEVYAAAAALAGSAALALAPHAGSHSATLGVLSLSAMGVFAAQAPLLAIAPTFLTGSSMASGFALVNTLGQFGGLIGPALVGYSKQRADDHAAGEPGGDDSDGKGTYSVGFSLLATFGVAVAPAILLYERLARRAERRRAARYRQVASSDGAFDTLTSDNELGDGLDEFFRDDSAGVVAL